MEFAGLVAVSEVRPASRETTEESVVRGTSVSSCSISKSFSDKKKKSTLLP
jgi:hypothetical protein